MNNKIIFWESQTPTANQERKNFWDKLRSLSLKITITKADLFDSNLIFIHGGDKSSLVEVKLDGTGENYIKEVTSIWKIIYGGNPTTQKKLDSTLKLVEYINIDDLNERLIHVLQKLQTNEINVDLLEELLFDFDPKLEKLLQPFADKLPLQENWKGTNLHQEKELLIKEINKKLKQ